MKSGFLNRTMSMSFAAKKGGAERTPARISGPNRQATGRVRKSVKYSLAIIILQVCLWGIACSEDSGPAPGPILIKESFKNGLAGQFDLTKLDPESIEYLRVDQEHEPLGLPVPIVWDFKKPESAWVELKDLERDGADAGYPRYVAKSEGGSFLPLLASPGGLGIRAEDIESVVVNMKVSEGKKFYVLWEKEAGPGNAEIENFFSKGRLDFFPHQSIMSYVSAENRFVEYSINIASTGSWSNIIDRIFLIPTDGEDSRVSIQYVKLIPKNYRFLSQRVGISDVFLAGRYVRSFFACSSSSISAPLATKEQSRFDVQIAKKNSTNPGTFLIRVEDSSGSRLLHEETLNENEKWKHISLSLPSPFTGKLVLETVSDEPDSIFFWGNPIVHDDTEYEKNINIIVYLIDALRADHVGVYGYERDTTPNIDAFAGESIIFDNSIAQASWTRPSVASIMTSTYVFVHGADRPRDTVPGELKKITEVLSENGYYTAGFLTNWNVGHDARLAAGYDYLVEKSGFHNTNYYSSKKVNEVLFPWLSQNYKKRFYIYVHTVDPHSPYEPPPRFSGVFSEGVADSQMTSTKITPDILKGLKEKGDIEYALAKYDEEILASDYQFGRLIKHLKELGIYNSSIIILTSDHGEQFQEHGSWEHGFSSFQEEIHVPLIMKLPRTTMRTRYAPPVEQIDIYPTLLSVLGLPLPDTVQGRPLLSISNRQTQTGRHYVFSEQPVHGPRTTAIIKGKEKYIWHENPDKPPLLFDLKRDPHERNSVASRNPWRVRQFNKVLSQWRNDMDRYKRFEETEQKSTVDEEVLEDLKALGYIE